MKLISRMNKKKSNILNQRNLKKPADGNSFQGSWSILGLVALAELVFFTISMLRPGKKNLKDNPASIIKVAGSC